MEDVRKLCCQADYFEFSDDENWLIPNSLQFTRKF
jgi:hypothetical protein